MDEVCFLGFYIYMYLLLLINVATVSRGAPVLVASNLIKSLFFKVFVKLPPPPDSSSSSCCCIVYSSLSLALLKAHFLHKRCLCFLLLLLVLQAAQTLGFFHETNHLIAIKSFTSLAAAQNRPVQQQEDTTATTKQRHW